MQFVVFSHTGYDNLIQFVNCYNGLISFELLIVCCLSRLFGE